MILAVHQPQFAPWLGYFDKMRQADHFVVLDDVQFKKNEWQNRNRIKTPQGAAWFTVPVQHRHGQKIDEILVNNTAPWQKKLRATVEQSYRKAPFFKLGEEFFDGVFGETWEKLADLNLFSIRWLAQKLEIQTEITLSSSLSVPGASSERLVHLCETLGAKEYLAGAGGQNYMDLSVFERAGIKTTFQEYRHPTYSQLHGTFESHLSALDLILNEGDRAPGIAFP